MENIAVATMAAESLNEGISRYGFAAPIGIDIRK